MSTIRAPSRASVSAAIAPMPEVAPVMTTTFPRAVPSSRCAARAVSCVAISKPCGPRMGAASALRPLFHPGLDLVEAGLGAGFVVSAAALLAVGAAEADRADEIVAGHDR